MVEVGECKSPVAAGDGAGELDYDIVPGDSEVSILDFRMESNEPLVRMPEIGRSVVHTEGVELMRLDQCHGAQRLPGLLSGGPGRP